MNFNVFNSLILAGIIQGFIFAIVVLLTKKYRARSTFFLVALILCYSFGNLQYLLPDLGIMPLNKMYTFVYLPWATLTPPLLYFYILLFLYPSKKFVLLEKLIYLPFLVFFIFTIVYRIGVILHYINDSFYTFFRSVIGFHEIIAIILSIIILLVLIKKVVFYDKQNREFKIGTIRTNINWLKIILPILFILTLIWTYLTHRVLNYNENDISFYPLWVGIAATIYLLGHVGIYKFGIIEERKKIRNHNLKNKKRPTNEHIKNEHIMSLENLFLNEKVFLDSNLSLESIAENLNISSSYLSRIINNELKTSFTDYLNSYRIEEAKTYLENPEFFNYTIISIGLEAGFNSKSTFYYVFKKATGKTPLAYKKEKLSA